MQIITEYAICSISISIPSRNALATLDLDSENFNQQANFGSENSETEEQEVNTEVDMYLIDTSTNTGRVKKLSLVIK